jgi:hypothetical protein
MHIRHKLIHVAEPLLSVIQYETRRIAWRYNHYNLVNHLIFVPAATTNNNIQIARNWSIEFDEIFEISILGLADDIINSVYKDGGYLQMLEKDIIYRLILKKVLEIYMLYLTLHLRMAEL